MLKKILAICLFCFTCTNIVNAKELLLQKNKIYILSFNEEIQNIHSGGKWLDAQILHTLNDDKKQIVLSLKENKNGFLQVKTENNLYNYEAKNSTTSSKELLQVDYPPIENLEVDIYMGD